VSYLFVSKTQQNNPVHYINHGDCRIGFFRGFSTQDEVEMLKQIDEIKRENSLKCNARRVILFDFYKAELGHDYGRTLLSYCSLDNDKKIVSCDNYYYTNWRVDEK
jgi:hypothetical protein